MKSIKLLLFFCVAVSFSSCSTLKLTKSAPFRVFGATYHNWVGGQPGVSGTNLIIGVENDANITFKKIYFHNKVVDASTTERKGKKYVIANISTSAEMVLETRTKTTVNGGVVMSDERNNPKIKRETIPFNLEPNEAVVSYISGKKTYYYKVSKIKKTDTVFYP
ncbi:hypothetical protein [Polaribacter gochangensis]|uniref:hypothetical protein n=1 Tax=Polaribacter gochangensis TaxID=3252903 RepID=UPI0039046F67